MVDLHHLADGNTVAGGNTGAGGIFINGCWCERLAPRVVLWPIWKPGGAGQINTTLSNNNYYWGGGGAGESAQFRSKRNPL